MDRGVVAVKEWDATMNAGQELLTFWLSPNTNPNPGPIGHQDSKNIILA
jgi:hypothetical protein